MFDGELEITIHVLRFRQKAGVPLLVTVWTPRGGNAEVDDLDCVAFHHKDFAGFEDAMNKAVLMGGL